ncbi:organomercurial lyase MerB [Sciscionella marina]|uniref:organomercurial lyase MerB n=1 Tax=Sciscionella marina TaxID=508770 RepID=UPI000378DFE8|nr:organomercurial lyase MerB [Sciscionella marina]
MTEEQIHAGVQKLIGVVNANLAMPDLLPHLWRLLVDLGEPVSAEHLAAAGGWPMEKVQAELARQPGVDWDEHGRIAGFGLTLRPTPHAFTFDRRTVYGWCATDTLQFPRGLGHPGVVDSTCPATGQHIRIELTPNGIVRVDPPEALVSKMHLTRAVANLRDLCDLGHFFSSRKVAADWLTAHPQGEVIPVAEEFQVVRRASTELGWTALSAPSPPAC